MNTAALIDAPKLLDRLEDDKELMKEIFAVFIGEAPERLAKILSAFEAMDMNALTRLAHALKGASGTLAAEPLREASSALEMASRTGDAEGVAESAPMVLDILARTVEFMATVDVAGL